MTPRERALARQMSWSPRLGFGNVQGGRRKTPQKGESLEFADMRDYHPGDDPRRIDWNAYARHGELNIKLFHDEQNLDIYLLADTSASMASRTPDYWDILRAAALPALSVGDRLTLIALNEGEAHPAGTFQGRGSEDRFEIALESLELSGRARLDEAVRRAIPRMTGRGVVVLVSDFFEDGYGLEALRLLRGRRDDLVALQVLNIDEVDPEFGGDVSLVDSEDASQLDVHMSDRILKDYRRRLENLRRLLNGACNGMGRVFLPLDPRRGLVTDFLTQARRRGVLS